MTAKDKRLYQANAAYRAAKIDPKTRPRQNSVVKHIGLIVTGVILITAFVIVVSDAMKGGK